MLASYTTLREPPDDVAITRFADRREGRLKATTIHAVLSLAIALDLAEKALELETQFLDGFSALAERKLHDEGKWPARLEYPVARPQK
jgi:hypothetical protein